MTRISALLLVLACAASVSAQTLTPTQVDIRRVGGTAVSTSDNPASEAPLLFGGVGSSTVPSAVSANGDKVRFWLTLNGAQNTVLRDSTGDSAMDDANNAVRVNIVSGLFTDTEDGSIAGGQTVGIRANLNYVWNAGSSAWVRATNADATRAQTALDTGPQMLCYGSSSAPTSVTNGQAQQVWCTTGGAIRIDPVGTTTQPVSVASLPLPSGAATEASVDGLEGGVGAASDAAATAGSTGSMNAKLRLITSQLDTIRTRQAADPCFYGTKTVIPINISTATTTELTPSLAGSGNYYYICSINIGPVAGAQNFALVDDDSDGCGSVTSGLAGGISAGSGWNIAANGGLTFGNGLGTIAKTNGTNRVVCAVTSAAVQTSGVMTVVAAP